VVQCDFLVVDKIKKSVRNVYLIDGSSGARNRTVFNPSFSRNGKFSSVGCPDLYNLSSTKPKFRGGI
jgi:hypothetical protein